LPIKRLNVFSAKKVNSKKEKLDIKKLIMRKYILYLLCLLLTAQTQAQVKPNASSTTPVVTGVKPLPAPYTSTPVNYMRSYSPQIPMQDTSLVNMAALVENVQTSITYSDGYGRTIQTVAKQLSPAKKDNVGVANFDHFGRPGTQAYMPYAATTNDGMFKQNAFVQDSIFYKTHYPTEQVIYSQTQYDGSPMNLPVKSMAAGNEWGGANRGKTLAHRNSKTTDSVRYWNINIINEDDIPTTTSYYVPSTLSVQEITDERGIKSITYTDLAGRTILTKAQDASVPSTGHNGWLCTYYIYDEMGQLRVVIPPKAVQQLQTANWQLPTVALQGLCYSYFYDNRGRQICKSIPGKGKSYIAYDLYDRPVMTQDPNLRQTNKWAFVLYDVQSRPIKSGAITSTLSKDSIQAQAARSLAYPTLAGTYTVMTETYYDNHEWVSTEGYPVGTYLDGNNINSTNFITNYNTAPDYAQPLNQSQRIRGAVTGTKTIILGTNNYIYAATYYDNNGRAIQTQQKNHTGGTDVATIQYSYKGTVLRSHLSHSKAGSNAQTHNILTKYTYDHVGRLLTTTKNIDNLGDKAISELSYYETGQVRTKQLSPLSGGGGGGLQTYTYNMQGMLTGINAPYVTQASNTGKEYFGEILSYTSGFTSNQYNGGIAGVQWKNAGDSNARAYGYTYDNVGRLTRADFTQQNSGATAWTNDKVDYTVSGLSYDAGGNILTMQQKGLLAVGGNATIDNLTYTYFANGNRLQKVTDLSTAGGMLGDFKDSTTTADDYAYDANGNIVKDNNRRLHNTNGSIGTLFNLLDKPDSMAVAGKSCTYYTYDAAGSTLTKRVKDYRTNTTKIYTYVAGFVYLSSSPLAATQPLPDTLQYAMFEEGRMRWKTSPTAVVFDYMLKDHAGNVRTVITDERKMDVYPFATMDNTPAIKDNENAIYAGLDLTREIKPAGYPATDIFTVPNTNNYVAKVQAIAGSQKIGPSLTLKVMKGDSINIRVSSWYKLNGATPTTPPINTTLANIVGSLISGISGSAVVNTHGVTANQFTTANSFTPDVTTFLNNQTNNNYNTAKPKAYLNWIYFDEQFNIVSSSSGADQVGADQEFKPHVQQTVATKCGFLYVYVSNETPNIPVYFDNLQVSHIRSPLLETNEYYSYGLKMASISYKVSMTMTNRYGWNGGNEYEDEGELNYSNTFYRKYDAQIGRFTGVDMLAEEFADLNPYQFGANNPVMFNDPTGALTTAEFNTIINTLWDSDYGGYWSSAGGGGGGGGDFFRSNAEALGWGIGNMDRTNSWGAYEGWAKNRGEAIDRFSAGGGGGSVNGIKAYNYTNKSFSGMYSNNTFEGDKRFSRNAKEEYYFANYGDIFDFRAIMDGYALQTKSVGEEVLEATHATLDIVSFLPIIGTGAALINAGIYLGEGNLSSAGTASLAAIPFTKIVSAGLKYGSKTIQAGMLLLTSSKSTALSRTYTIFEESGALYKFGVTDANLVRFNQSIKEAGQGVYGVYSSTMAKKEAHVLEKYLRSLQYNSTGVWQLPGMRVPYPVNFVTGLPIKKP
jgi:RHS repeat-associated protein